MKPNFFQYKHYHLIGIKGVAMTALALILQDMGKKVTGSDLSSIYATDRLLQQKQIKPLLGFNAKNIGSADAVIYSASHQGSRNIEVITAKKQNLACFSLAQAIGSLTQAKKTVAISGSHGKTTTTALISYCLLMAKKNPTYLVGSAGFMKQLSGAYNSGEWFVVEADEYLVDPVMNRQPKFWQYTPEVIVTTNLDYDHPDFYADFEAVSDAFAQFFQRLKPNGKLIVNGDDSRLLALAESSAKPFVSFGYKKSNHYQIRKTATGFGIYFQQQPLVELQPQLMGKHNQLNLTAAVVFLHQTGFELSSFVPFLNEFQGAKRRLELIAKIINSLVYDDYAHHPTEITASLQALKTRYPKHKIALFFQPHTYSRTTTLLPEFAKSLSTVNYLGLLPIFASSREQMQSNHDLESLKGLLPQSLPVTLIKNPSDYSTMIKKTQAISKHWLYVTMGAGDINESLSLIIQILKHG